MADEKPETPARKAGAKPDAGSPATSPIRAPRTLGRRELEVLRNRLQSKFH